MIELKIDISHASISVERQARLIIEMWQEARHVYEDPDVRVIIDVGGSVVVYDGTGDLASLVQEMERHVAGLRLVDAADADALLFRCIKVLHKLACELDDAVTYEIRGHPVTVRPEDDPLTLWQEYVSQWEA